MFFDSRNLDSFDQYLQDVERYPLIADPKEEREIARRARVAWQLLPGFGVPPAPTTSHQS